MPGLGRLGLGLSTPRGGSLVVVSDTFTRADNAASLGNADTGQAWTAHAGTWGVLSNQGYTPTPAADGCASVDALVANCTVSAVCAAAGPGDFGIVARISNATNFVRLIVTGGNAFFQKNVAGAFTSFATQAWTLANGDLFTITCSGNTLIARINGTLIGSANDAFNAAVTRHGVSNSATGSEATVRWDNFKVTVP